MDEVKTFRALLKTVEAVKREFGALLELKSNLTMPQWCVLKEINLSESNITSKDLEVLTSTDKATMSEILSKLVKKGYITKEQDKEDRRKFNIRMSGDHEELCKEIMKIEKEYFSNLFKEFESSDYKNVTTIINKIEKGSDCNGK